MFLSGYKIIYKVKHQNMLQTKYADAQPGIFFHVFRKNNLFLLLERIMKTNEKQGSLYKVPVGFVL